MPATRRQLSLYLSSEISARIDQVRRIVDPIQWRLIPPHLTLCREDELGTLSLETLRQRVNERPLRPLELRFGPAERFAGHGLLLPCVEGEEQLQSLRERLLGGPVQRLLRAHLTLAHPRNPRAAGNSLAAAADLGVLPVTCRTLCLIEQAGEERWRVLARFEVERER